jgi:hypothetical protein
MHHFFDDLINRRIVPQVHQWSARKFKGGEFVIGGYQPKQGDVEFLREGFKFGGK